MSSAAAEVLHPTTTAIVEYSQTEAALAELRQQLADATFDVTTPAGMKEARDSRFALVKLRSALEDKRKELKAPLLDRGRVLDAEAKRITAAVLELEQPIDDKIKEQERILDAAREEAARRERERLAELQRRIESLRDRALEYMSAPSSVVAEAIAELESKPLDAEAFGVHLPDAVAARNSSLAKLREILDAARTNERIAAELRAQREEQEQRRQAEDKRLADERAELDRLRQEEEARQANARAEREAAEKRAAAERQAADEAAAAERERQAAEARAEQARIAEEQAAERKRLDAERAELARQREEAAARANEERIANATLSGAARDALDLLRDLGKGDHVVTLALAAAIERDEKPEKPAKRPARRRDREAA
ncbi:hypothetical protein [Lysobacter sp. CA199]|uniref:hypothetical protein n=1 Tax=Lysobacter sp. CA199 TaxID=3455608 RepID=UPI003F8D5577